MRGRRREEGEGEGERGDYLAAQPFLLKAGMFVVTELRPMIPTRIVMFASTVFSSCALPFFFFSLPIAVSVSV